MILILGADGDSDALDSTTTALYCFQAQLVIDQLLEFTTAHTIPYPIYV